MRIVGGVLGALAYILAANAAVAADMLKLAIGQRGVWDSAIGEIGMQVGIFQKHGLELQLFYTSGGGETQQAVISGSADIGVAAGTLGVLGAFVKGAPIRIIAGEATGTAEYYLVRADSPVQKDFKGVRPEMTLAYSTAGSSTHITALRFMKEYGFQAKPVATGNVPATFTAVMSGQIDIGFSTPPFGLDALDAGKGRLIALANDLPSVRNQTVRLIIANAADLAKRREVYDRFIAAYRETIDYMYANDKALELFAKFTDIPVATARTVRDRFYPKSMLQLDSVAGIDALMQDAIAFKYIPAALNEQQLKELLQLPKR
jgi:ABC-type nitrate/sulfonate/bicarbonate transport system substrate-binding protein